MGDSLLYDAVKVRSAMRAFTGDVPDALCANVAALIEVRQPEARFAWGCFVTSEAHVAHAWNVVEGHIFDATADQFGAGGHLGVVVTLPGDSRYIEDCRCPVSPFLKQ